jgi:hypothetical protein
MLGKAGADCNCEAARGQFAASVAALASNPAAAPSCPRLTPCSALRWLIGAPSGAGTVIAYAGLGFPTLRHDDPASGRADTIQEVGFMVKRNMALAALFVVALAFVACDDPAEKGRNIVDIKDFNGGMPVQSDVLYNNLVDPPYIPEDLIPVSFSARPYNDFITGNTHNQIIIDDYTITWTRSDGGSVLPTRTESSHIVISVGSATDAAIRLTTWADKTGPILSPLVGTSNSITMQANIRFTGREMGTEKEVEAVAAVSVNFADTANE